MATNASNSMITTKMEKWKGREQREVYILKLILIEVVEEAFVQRYYNE